MKKQHINIIISSWFCTKEIAEKIVFFCGRVFVLFPFIMPFFLLSFHFDKHIQFLPLAYCFVRPFAWALQHPSARRAKDQKWTAVNFVSDCFPYSKDYVASFILRVCSKYVVRSLDGIHLVFAWVISSHRNCERKWMCPTENEAAIECGRVSEWVRVLWANRWLLHCIKTIWCMCLFNGVLMHYVYGFSVQTFNHPTTTNHWLQSFRHIPNSHNNTTMSNLKTPGIDVWLGRSEKEKRINVSKDIAAWMRFSCSQSNFSCIQVCFFILCAKYFFHTKTTREWEMRIIFHFAHLQKCTNKSPFILSSKQWIVGLKKANRIAFWTAEGMYIHFWKINFKYDKNAKKHKYFPIQFEYERSHKLENVAMQLLLLLMPSTAMLSRN